jgi:hypothetical protein
MPQLKTNHMPKKMKKRPKAMVKNTRVVTAMKRKKSRSMMKGRVKPPTLM